MPATDLLELFKTPAISAMIAAAAAILSAPLVQRLNRRSNELQWLREQRARAYADRCRELSVHGQPPCCVPELQRQAEITNRTCERSHYCDL